MLKISPEKQKTLKSSIYVGRVQPRYMVLCVRTHIEESMSLVWHEAIPTLFWVPVCGFQFWHIFFKQFKNFHAPFENQVKFHVSTYTPFNAKDFFIKSVSNSPDLQSFTSKSPYFHYRFQQVAKNNTEGSFFFSFCFHTHVIYNQIWHFLLDGWLSLWLHQKIEKKKIKKILVQVKQQCMILFLTKVFDVCDQNPND